MIATQVPLSRRVRWATWRWRRLTAWLVRRAWLILTGRGIQLHPDRLDGYDGEPPHFVRHDLARTPEEVRQILLAEWGYTEDDVDVVLQLGDVKRVWMRLSPGSGPYEDEGDGSWYLPVFEGSPGAVPYWSVDE